MAKAKAEEQPMRRFRLIKGAGDHQEAGTHEPGTLDMETRQTTPGKFIPGKVYKEGDIIESPHDLVTMFPNKFEELSAEASREFKAAQKQREKSEKEAAEENPETSMSREEKIGRNIDPDDTDKIKDNKPMGTLDAQESKLGENVTAEFDKAVEANVLVLKKGKNYFLARPDDPDRPINEESLKKSGVNGAVGKLMKSDAKNRR
jgi:hypothetical protein